MKSTKVAVLLGCALATSGFAGSITLGTFTFNDQQFGNTLTESDGGTFRNGNWLNTTNGNPGNPAALTGANFTTGIANLGPGSTAVDYTIGYTTPIVNGAGADFGLVLAFDYTVQPFHLAVSTDGTTFTSFVDFAGSNAVATGIEEDYFYGGNANVNPTFLAVLSIDLTSFGISSGASVQAIRLEARGSEGGDVIRAAGFGGSASPVPEPFSLLLTGSGLAALAVWRRRKA